MTLLLISQSMFWISNFILGVPKLFGLEQKYNISIEFLLLHHVKNILPFPNGNLISKTPIGNSEVLDKINQRFKVI
jgi:hypothetical protein